MLFQLAVTQLAVKQLAVKQLAVRLQTANWTANSKLLTANC